MSWSDAIKWWELRRTPYNAALLIVGCSSIWLVLYLGDQMVEPGEDVVEPLAVIFGPLLYALAANACYSLGWLTEIIDNSRSPQERQRLFWYGLSFSILVTAIPGMVAVFVWVLWMRKH
jgi:hypothetical protein